MMMHHDASTIWCLHAAAVVIFYGLPTLGLPPGATLVVKIIMGGLPPAGCCCCCFRGVVTLRVAGLLVVVFFSDRVSKGSARSDEESSL